MISRLKAVVAVRAALQASLHEVRDAAGYEINIFPSVGAPLSEAEVLAAERQIGLPLPPLLRRIYLEVGNGGFGPDWWLFRLADGADDGLESVVEEYAQCRLLPRWPTEMLPIGEAGCGRYYVLPAGTEVDEPPVLLYSDELAEWETHDSARHSKSATRFGAGFEPWRHSLEAWLTEWLDTEEPTVLAPGYIEKTVEQYRSFTVDDIPL